MASDELAVAAPAPSEAEIGRVVRRLAAAYASNVDWRMRELTESAEDADRRTGAADDPEEHLRASSEPADQVSWWTLTLLNEADSEAGWAVWERVKAEAYDELVSGHRVDRSEPDRSGPRAPLFTAGRVRTVLAAAPRLILLLVIVWAFTGPIDRVPLIVDAAGLAPAAPADSAPRAAPLLQGTGFAVADGPIASYFAARGGVRTFGPPVSNAFPLLGSTVQIFRDHVLKVEPNGSVSTVNLFALGAIPFRNVGGRIIPEVDPYLVGTAPVPGMPDYAARVQAFIQETAPDQWETMPVGFYQAFLGTVRYEDAFPNGGERALLTGFSHEVWGVPVSHPTRDAQDPNVVLLRWERGVMAWNRQTGSVTTVPLGETFKQVLTGEGLGPERTAAAAGSPFLMQARADAPNGVARPSELPDTVLTTSFTQGSPTIDAAQSSGPYYATPTPTPFVPAQQTNYNPPPPPLATITPTLPGGIGAASPVPGAAAPAGPDLCVRDEQIAYAPAEPRVNN
jgi:hypothetical protein